MIADPSREGLEQRFRPWGVGRFGAMVFLCVWLCGWAVGETVALFLVGSGIYSLVTGAPMVGGGPARLGPSLAVGCFLAGWLTLWTIGGVMAIRELLRSVWAEDRLMLDLELTESSDSDGDRWYQLDAIELSPPTFAGDRAGTIPARRKIDRAIHDPTGQGELTLGRASVVSPR